MEKKTFEFEIKEISEEGQFSGYLSTFGNVDAGGDMVDSGAFKKTLREKKTFPLNWGHVPDHPDLVVGSFGGKEDEKGLLIDGGFFLDLEGGKKAYLTAKKLFEKGIKMGLSMGYKTMKYLNETIDGMLVRRLKEVKLKEGALTLFPMNEEAMLDAIKEDMHIEEKPSVDNHICRINSGDYIHYRSEKRKHNGKSYTIRYGIRKDGKAEEYEYFYSKDIWSAATARSHCKEHDGTFEAAKKDGKSLILSEPGGKSTQKGEPGIFSPVIEVLEREKDKPHKHLLDSTISILEKKS